jgi:phospho-N-acetylmuramoyl-pentapeptide-transferase
MVKVFFPAIACFIIGISITPLLTHFFYKYKMWKKASRSAENSEEMSVNFKKIHNEKEELRTPRVGGIIIWLSILITILLIFLVSKIFPTGATQKLNFLSRNQTLLPLFTLIFASLIGLVDDLFQIYGKGKYARDPIFYRRIKIALIVGIGLVVGLWFFYKLGMNSIAIPFAHELYIGWLFIPFFILVMLAFFSSSVIDGIDGLSGGVLAPVFVALGTIAFMHLQIDIAVLCSVITAGILAFLWFNIPPARFYMGETGMIGLTVTITVIAFLTDTVLILPLIALPLVLTSLSVIIQMISKKYFHKKVFRIAPLHHHFEALGWPSYKVTMRFWIISTFCALFGVVIALIS